MHPPVVLTGDPPDRRRRPRLRLAYRVRLRRPGDTSPMETKTQNVSCEGFFCTIEGAFSPGESLDCELVISNQELGRSAELAMVLRCRAEVVRVAPQPGTRSVGLACRLADYTIGRQTIEHDVADECLT